MSYTSELTVLTADWRTRYRHRIPSGVLLSGREHPHATVIAGGLQDMAVEPAKGSRLNERKARQ